MLSLAYQKQHFETISAKVGCQTTLVNGISVTSTISNCDNRKLTTLSTATLNQSVRAYIEEKARICKPDQIQVCDGSESENQTLIELMVKDGMLEKLPKYENCWLAHTDPADVARVESKTVISTPDRNCTIPTPREGVKGTLGKFCVNLFVIINIFHFSLSLFLFL